MAISPYSEPSVSPLINCWKERVMVAPGAPPGGQGARQGRLLGFVHRHQAGVAAGRRGVDRDRAFAGEAQQVVRAAGLGAGPGEAFAAEGLDPDYGTNDVAIDVGVADVQARGDEAA